MKKTLLIAALCSCLLLSPALAAPAVPLDEDAIRARIAASPSLKNAGEEDAIILFEGDTIDYADGKAVWRHQELIRLYSEYAIEHFGDPRVAWDASRQELTIHANRSYLNDGTAQDAPGNAHNEVTPFGLDLAVDFIDIREMVITRVGLERGVTVWLDYTIRDLAPGWLPYGRHFFFHSEFPVKERELVAKGLEGATVNPEMTPSQIQNPVELADGLLWQATDLPPRPLDMGPRTGDAISWAAVYETGNWQDFGAKLMKHYNDSIADLESLKVELDSLDDMQHPLNPEETLQTWLDWIDTRVRRVRHDLLPWARPPRGINEILASSTASDGERAALLLACCRIRELPADLYIPAHWRSMMEGPVTCSGLEAPSVSVKSATGSSVHVDSGSWRIDPQPEPRLLLSPFGGAAGVNVRWLDRWKIDDYVQMKIFWDCVKGEAKASVNLFGPATQNLDFADPVRFISDWAAGWTEGSEPGEIRILNMTPNSLRCALDLKAPKPEADEQGYLVLKLPMPPIGPDDFRPGGLDQPARDALWSPENNLSMDLEWRIRLPEDWEIRLPSERDAMGCAVSVEREGDECAIRFLLSWTADTMVSRDDWPAFRKAMLDAFDPATTQIVLKKATD